MAAIARGTRGSKPQLRRSDNSGQGLATYEVAVLQLTTQAVWKTADFLSSGRAPLLAPSPLGTGLEGFPFIRLEHPKTPMNNEDAA